MALLAMLASAAFAGQAVAAAAPAPAAPAAAPAAKQASATVKTVEGTVETRPAIGQPWVPVKVGDQLAEGADLRTGFRARCLLEMTQSLVNVDPLTVVRIGELRRDGATVRTRLYLKQGNLESDVSKVGQKNDFAIVTPSATLSVRGTQGIGVSFFPVFGGEYSLTGSGLIALLGALGHQTLVYPGQVTDDGATPFFTWLHQQFESKVIDQYAFDTLEKWANLRWHTGTLIPLGLNGATGGPLQGALGGGTGDNGDGGISPPPDTGGDPYPPYDPGEGGFGAPNRTGKGTPSAPPHHGGKVGRVKK
jgi:hypothetical protein